MERYIVFIKDMGQDKEFTVIRQARAGMHAVLCEELAEKYRYPQYVVHTAYTETELKNVLSSLERWYGPKEISEELEKRDADAAEVQQMVAQRAEWDALTQAYRQRQKAAQKGVQATEAQPKPAMQPEPVIETPLPAASQSKPATYKPSFIRD